MRPLRLRIVLCAAALAAVAGKPALAADAGLYIGGEGGVNFLDDENVRQAGTFAGRMRYKDGFVGGLVIGAWTDIGFRPEIEVDYRRNNLARFHEPNGISVATRGYNDAYSAMGNLWWEANMPDGFFHVVHPYLGGGAGSIRIGFHEVIINGVPARADNDTVFAWQAGGGIGLNLTRDVIASVDYRYLQSNIADFNLGAGPGFQPDRMRYRANTLMAGLQVRFGVAPEKEVVIVKEQAPPPPPPPPPPKPDPCALDSDHDGVNDCEDKCPNTAQGFKVDANGCIIEQTVVLHTVNFEFDKAVLTAPAREILNDIASTLKGQPELYVEIGGHTDSIGSPQYNRGLSQRRADAVMTYLTSQGISAAHLTARGYGEDVPIASNRTEDGRAENRRVEFKVLQQPPNAKVVPGGPTEASKAAAKTEPASVKRRHGQ